MMQCSAQEATITSVYSADDQPIHTDLSVKFSGTHLGKEAATVLPDLTCVLWGKHVAEESATPASRFNPDRNPDDRATWYAINRSMPGWSVDQRWDYLLYGDTPHE